MPTIFGRRYMRKVVPRRERVIGLGILLLLTVILVVFVVLGLRSERSLFELAQGVEPGRSEAPETRDLRVARAMLPSLGTAGWTRDDEITLLDAAELPAPLPDFGLLRAFRGRYVKSADPDQIVRVEIFEARAPENALAVLQLRAAPDGTTLPAGNRGWLLGDRGGFWSGRYYTEFDRSAVRDEQPSVKVITDALASVQLVYGPPFWAEAVFPTDGLQAETLRFLPVGLQNLPRLQECFAVDYADGTLAVARRTGSNDAAQRLLSRIADDLATTAQLDQTPTPQQPVVSGSLGEDRIFLFASGEAVGGAIGPNLDGVSRIASTMLAQMRPSSAGAASPATRRAAASPFPEIELPGWQTPDNVATFAPTNLWEKINGRADLYLAYNVAGLTFGTYHGDAEMALDVYWYDMTETDNAFGIFSAEYAAHAEPADVGRDGYQAGGGVFFWKGAQYVRIEATEESPALTQAATAIALAIATAIPDSDQPLWAESLLPEQDRLPESFEYEGENALSLDFLRSVFSADYESSGEQYKLFVHRAPDANAAAQILAAYTSFFEEYGTVLQRVDGEAGLLIGESGGVIDAVFVSGLYLGGVSGVEDSALARRQAEAFRARIAEQQPGN